MPPSQVMAREPKSLRRRLGFLILTLVLLLGLAAAWSLTPLRDRLDVTLIVSWLQQLGTSLGPVTAVFGFAAAVAAAVPLTFLLLVSVLTFGAWKGFACSLAGALIGASLSFGMGRVLGREVVRRIGGERINEISRRLADRGLWAVIAARLVPIAPFALINMMAGASDIRLRDLLLGTAIGMMPSTLAMMLFADQLIAVLKRPGPLTLLLLLLTLGLIGIGVWGLRRWLRGADRR